MSWLKKFKIENNIEKKETIPSKEVRELMNSVSKMSVPSASSINYTTPFTSNTVLGNSTYGIYPSMRTHVLGGATPSISAPSSLIQFSKDGKEIVRLNVDGSVTWADGIKIDEAAEEFAKSLSLSVEVRANITQKVKLRIRDSVFEDIIAIAKEKGSLTAEDLTYLLEASKIVEKLSGTEK